MTDLQVFEKEGFGKVRVVMQDGEPRFVASDVARALGYADPAHAVLQHCKKSNKISLQGETLGRKASVELPPVPPVNIIPESDVYRLVMRSNLPGAERFQDWVCEDVLPSIRKTGQYAVANIPDFKNPAIAARAWAEQYERRQIAEAQRDEAIRTKAQIGARREATSMATASAAVRKANALEDEIGRGRTFKQVKAIDWLGIVFARSNGMYSAVGKYLKHLSERMAFPVKKIPSSEYPGGVNAYHVRVIDAFHNEVCNNPDLLHSYRFADLD